jgi:hypothetical protein
MDAEALSPAIAALLASAGHASGISEVTALPAGGNNRVYRVQAGARAFAVKRYFHDASDPRDRLRAEYGFLRHAWRSGIRGIPEPIASDPASHLALFEFVEGRKPQGGDIDVRRVLEAAELIAALNSKESRSAGAGLPQASDACSGIAEHVRSVDRRVERLKAIPAQSDSERKAKEFLLHLAGEWSRARAWILGAAEAPGAQSTARCLSPSDFGFHNALIRSSGDLCFLDFEYAGWDDPAKLVGDFFWHAGMRPARAHFERFAAAALSPFEDVGRIIERTRLLSPAFRARWSCIALNEFLPDAARRRRFADAGEARDTEQRKLEQLDKARALFSEPDL